MRLVPDRRWYGDAYLVDLHVPVVAVGAAGSAVVTPPAIKVASVIAPTASRVNRPMVSLRSLMVLPRNCGR